ncbi:MAG: PIN domain-containing protein [Bacteroidia bacterium]|nr:PIN domain-containing protein [Bacteroidia bacterium]
MYLLDTNIVIFLFKGHQHVTKKINSVGFHNCAISEITVAELKYGAEKSNWADRKKLVNDFIEQVSVVPISGSLDSYATERLRLEKEGQRLDDFDLLIGATAIANKLILISNNVKHLERLNNIKIEDWTKE